jgi:hypothetical protein
MMNLRRFLGLSAGVLAIATAASACVSGSIVLPDSQCDNAQVLCGTGCVDTQTDPRNCGGCDKTCKIAEGEACVMGVCGKACAGGATRCGAACADLQTDRANCGACGKACLADEACNAGKCGLVCQGSLTACMKPATPTPPPVDAGADASTDAAASDASVEAGYDGGAVSTQECVDTKTNPQHCGGCGMACTADKPLCSNGTCIPISPIGPGVHAYVDPTKFPMEWTQCFTQKYDAAPTPVANTLAACPGSRLLLGCRAAGATVLTVAAAGRREDVLFDTGTGQPSRPVVRVANGVAWYFSTTWSWGFAVPNDGVDKVSCDVAQGAFPELRMCWHTSAGNFNNGYRCGSNTNSAALERVIYQAP